MKRRVSNLLVELTNVHRLDPDALLDMCAIGVVRYFVGQHLRLAQGVHESRASSTRCTYKPHPKPKNEFRVQRKEWLDSEAKKNIPTTMTVNWTPFFTLFPLRLPANDILAKAAVVRVVRRVELSSYLP